MTKRDKPQRRKRGRPIKPLLHRDRCPAARVWRIHPEPGRPFVVEVRIARNADRMCMAGVQQGVCRPEQHRDAAGFVHSYYSHAQATPKRYRIRPRGVVAHMFLNERQLRERPSEIPAHECTHAAMGYVKALRLASPYHDEEPLAYAVGHLTQQLNVICWRYRFGLWRD